MIHRISEQITHRLIGNQIIPSDEAEIYVYGLEAGLGNAVLYLITGLISLWFGNLWHYVAFFVVFVPLRIFAGGIHAKTQVRCTVISCVLYTVSIYIANAYGEVLNTRLVTIVLAAMLAITASIAPVEHENNPLLPEERRHNQIIAWIVLITVLLLILLTGIWFPEITGSVRILAAMHFVLLMGAKLQSEKRKHRIGKPS